MNELHRPDKIRVSADNAPGEHRTDSDEAFWWLPVLGPTSTWLAFLLARHAAYGERCWDTATLARTIGLAGNRSKLWAALERLEMFGVAHFHATDVITVRVNLPALRPRQLACLPDDLAATYTTRPMATAG